MALQTGDATMAHVLMNPWFVTVVVIVLTSVTMNFSVVSKVSVVSDLYRRMYLCTY